METHSKRLDLNADLGEGEPESLTSELMPLLDSANIACGGHAGNPNTMLHCVRLAMLHGVKIGAHPGWPDREFGRGIQNLTPKALEDCVTIQIAAMAKICQTAGASLHHVKLHGALYHATEAHQDLADAFLRLMREAFPNVIIYAFAGGSVVSMAPKFGVEVWGEAFVDRAYALDGRLVPRDQPSALLENPAEVSSRVLSLLKNQTISELEGNPHQTYAKTLCIHADSPNALRVAQQVRDLLNLNAPIQPGL